jgi:hypothetical protein
MGHRPGTDGDPPGGMERAFSSRFLREGFPSSVSSGRRVADRDGRGRPFHPSNGRPIEVA